MWTLTEPDWADLTGLRFDCSTLVNQMMRLKDRRVHNIIVILGDASRYKFILDVCFKVPFNKKNKTIKFVVFPLSLSEN